MDSLFERFILEKRYLSNLSENTLDFYQSCFKAYQRVFSGLSQEPLVVPTKDSLKDFVIGLQKAGTKTSTINCYCRGINSYLAWLHAEGHIREPLKLKLLKQEKKLLKPLTDSQLRQILSYKPRSSSERRLIVLLTLLIDCGLRVDEAMGLEKSRVKFENMMLTVKGKGNKERSVPFSVECRKVLFKYLRNHKFDLVFCNRHGGKLRYDNLRRDWNLLIGKLGIETDGAFHSLRRTFATNFAREGGSVFALQSILGHASIQTTQRYVGLNTEDLQRHHARTSLLRRLG